MGNFNGAAFLPRAGADPLWSGDLGLSEPKPPKNVASSQHCFVA